MIKLTRGLLAVACAFVWGDSADAHDAPITVGVHLYSAHLYPSQGYQNFTPGLFVERYGIVAGGYTNSDGGRSVYAGYIWRGIMGTPLDIMAGAVTGYKRAPVLPMLVPSVLLPFGIRLSWVPAPGKDSSFHISFETAIENPL